MHAARRHRAMGSRQLIVMAICVLISCGKDDPMGGPSEPGLDLAAERQAMAVHVSDHFIKPAYENLALEMQALANATNAFTTERSEHTLEGLRAALKSTWLSWQEAAIYQFGPTENNALRAALNLYPSDEEKIEGNIAAGTYTFGSIANKGAEGLPALDYLVNAGAAEMIMADFEQSARVDYLLALVEEMVDAVQAVQQQWSDGTFLPDFTSDQSRGTDVGSAVGQLTNAIDLHFQRFLRDGKVAIPSGVRSAGVPRPKAVESLHGGYGRDLLVRGIEAYQDLFEGRGIDDKSGPSYYRYLESLDQAGIVTDLRARFGEALARSKGLHSDFAVQIEMGNQALVDVFLNLQEIVTLIKSDMASVMGITITNQDNDGD